MLGRVLCCYCLDALERILCGRSKCAWYDVMTPPPPPPLPYTQQVAPFFLDSCAQIGIPTVEDFNKPGGREGAGYYDFTIRSGVRDSVASAMLGDIIMGKDERTNLDILSGALVTRVLFNSSGPSVRYGAICAGRHRLLHYSTS